MSGGGGGGNNRRATSLGKGHLSHAAAARLARTSSWNDGLDGAGSHGASPADDATTCGQQSILRVFFFFLSPRDAGPHLNRSLTHQRHPLVNGWLVRVMALRSLIPFWHPNLFSIQFRLIVLLLQNKKERNIWWRDTFSPIGFPTGGRRIATTATTTTAATHVDAEDGPIPHVL